MPQEVEAGLAGLALVQAVCGTVAQTRRAMCVADVQASGDPTVRLIKDLGVRAYACFPLLAAGDRLLGTLSFGSRRRDRLSEGDLAFLGSIARYLAAVRERLRAEAALRASEARLRELQAELLHVSRLSAAGEMAAALAHELNQPLTAAASAVQAARRTLASASPEGLDGQPPEVREAMDLAAEQARRAGQIVRRLRDFVARGEADKRLESLPRLVEEAAALALVGAKERGVAVALAHRTRPAPGARRPDPDPAGAVQPDAQRPRGDGRRRGAGERQAGTRRGTASWWCPRHLPAPARSRSRWPTPARAWRRRWPDGCSSPSSRPSRKAWAWACRSAARSWRRMAGGSGPNPTREAARCSASPCRRHGHRRQELDRGPSSAMTEEDGRSPPLVSGAAGRRGADPGPASRAVHVIDDDEAVRRALAMLFRSAGIPVETHPSGSAFLEALPALREDAVGCVLTDVRMPGLDGLELLRRLKQGGFRRPVVVMTAHGDVAMAVRAMKAGAVDFVEKPFDDEALLAATEAALGTPQASGAAGADDAAERIAALSPREREVLDLLVAGKPNKLIARDLGLSPRTVEVHRARLMARLGVGSLAEAVRLAVHAELGARGNNRAQA